MRLIIEIPDEEYELLKHKSKLDNIAECIIANGIPLPKIEGRLIDEAMITECDREDGNYWVTNAPSIIGADKICPYCNEESDWESPHCPMCGRKLRTTDEIEMAKGLALRKDIPSCLCLRAYVFVTSAFLIMVENAFVRQTPTN